MPADWFGDPGRAKDPLSVIATAATGAGFGLPVVAHEEVFQSPSTRIIPGWHRRELTAAT